MLRECGPWFQNNRLPISDKAQQAFLLSEDGECLEFSAPEICQDEVFEYKVRIGKHLNHKGIEEWKVALRPSWVCYDLVK